MSWKKHFVAFGYAWHNGSTSMLYAYASSKGLKKGTHRPYNTKTGQPLTDNEWSQRLWSKLADEIQIIIAEHIHPHSAKEKAVAQKFLAHAQQMRDDLLLLIELGISGELSADGNPKEIA